MGIKTLFVIVAMLSQSIYANTNIPTYIITSNCVISIEVSDSKFNTGWTAIINIDNFAAESLLVFSKKHLKKQVRFIDGKGNKISSRDIMLQTPISKSIYLTGLKSRTEALIVKSSILSTKGLCGAK